MGRVAAPPPTPASHSTSRRHVVLAAMESHQKHTMSWRERHDLDLVLAAIRRDAPSAADGPRLSSQREAGRRGVSSRDARTVIPSARGIFWVCFFEATRTHRSLDGGMKRVHAGKGGRRRRAAPDTPGRSSRARAASAALGIASGAALANPVRHRLVPRRFHTCSWASPDTLGIANARGSAQEVRCPCRRLLHRGCSCQGEASGAGRQGWPLSS
jgi:hypothetical protein